MRDFFYDVFPCSETSPTFFALRAIILMPYKSVLMYRIRARSLMYEYTLCCEGNQQYKDTKYNAGRGQPQQCTAALLRKCVAIATVSATVNVNMDASTKPQRPSCIGTEFTSSL